MFDDLILYRNELKNKQIYKYKMIGIVAELLLSKKIFPKNNDIKEFILETFSIEFKDYVMKSRSMIVARISKIISVAEDERLYSQKLLLFTNKKIEEIKLKNEATFSYSLFDTYPDKIDEEKVDLGKLGNAGFRVYDASRVRENLAPARTVVDLHIEKLTDSWKHLSNFEILTIQLKAFEKFYDLAISHHQPSLIIIHGVGTGKLKDEIHEILKTKKEVKSFVNQYHPSYGYGATEIFFGF